jgi:hypothetical protein
MLRLACCLATEHGIKVCAPVHDALLIEASLNDLELTVPHSYIIGAPIVFSAKTRRIASPGFSCVLPSQAECISPRDWPM